MKITDILPPEIKNDILAAAITKAAAHQEFKTFLEIGASSGDGSTLAFLAGLKSHPGARLFCLEISKNRFNRLYNRHKNEPQITCYNMGSTSEFMSKDDVIDFYNIMVTKKNEFPLSTVLAWYNDDVSYAKIDGVPENGIARIKTENAIQDFDVVLIDGSGYTSRSEFKLTYGAKCYILDDINSIKNYLNYYSLTNDAHYKLIDQHWGLRNGYAIFTKKPCAFTLNTTHSLAVPPIKLRCKGIKDVLALKPLSNIYADIIPKIKNHITTCPTCKSANIRL